MENRISVKFENAGYEQTYKLGDDERFASIEGVKKLVDDLFVEQVLQQFQSMHRNKMETLSRNFPVSDTIQFEEII